MTGEEADRLINGVDACWHFAVKHDEYVAMFRDTTPLGYP